MIAKIIVSTISLFSIAISADDNQDPGCCGCFNGLGSNFAALESATIPKAPTIEMPSLHVEIRDEYIQMEVGMSRDQDGIVYHVVKQAPPLPPKLIIYTPEHNKTKTVYMNGLEYSEDARGNRTQAEYIR